MESQSQNPKSSSEAPNQAKPAQDSQAAGKASQTASAGGATDNTESERVSGPDTAAGSAGRVGTNGRDQGRTGSGKAPEWQTALQSSLQQGWTALSARVKTATPTQLALGAAAVGAAVWLGTRKRTSKASKSGQQSAADRWLNYPSGADGSRNDGHYGQYNRYSTPARGQYGSQQSGVAGSQYGSQSQASGQEGSAGESQTTRGTASGPYGHGNETWQRPTDERWDD